MTSVVGATHARPAAPPGGERGRGRHERASAFAAGLCVLLVTLLAWRGLLSAQLAGDADALIERAEQEGLARSLWVHGPGYFGEDSPDLYFRPLWLWSVELLHSAAGEEARSWFAVALGLHVLVVLVLFGVALRWTERPWLAAAAALAFALAPGPVQAVAWPSAALNTPPSALFLLVACAALWSWIERARPAVLGLVFGALILSLGFREAGYQLLPLGVAGACLVEPRRERRRGAAAVALAIGAIVSAHLLACTRVETGKTASALVTAVARGLDSFLTSLAGFEAPRWIVLALAGAAWVTAFARARSRTRFVLVWVAVAPFPYAVYPAPRFEYLFQLPLWLAAALVVEDLALRAPARARLVRTAGLACLAAMGVANAVRLPEARARYAAWGERCRATPGALAELGLAGTRTIAVDRIPAGLGNALQTMLRRATGDEIRFVELVTFQRPPFLLVAYGLAELAGEDAALLAWDEDADRYRPTTLQALAGELRPIPMYALVGRARVVAGPNEAQAAILDGSADLAREVLLYEEPVPPLGTSSSSIGSCRIAVLAPGRIELEVESAADGYLVLHMTPRSARGDGILVDGAAARAVPANGPFSAVRLPPGRRHVVVHTRAGPRAGPEREPEPGTEVPHRER